jgi:hypothetical protein
MSAVGTELDSRRALWIIRPRFCANHVSGSPTPAMRRPGHSLSAGPQARRAAPKARVRGSLTAGERPPGPFALGRTSSPSAPRPWPWNQAPRMARYRQRENAMWIASKPSAFITTFLVGLICGFFLGVGATRGHAAEAFSFSIEPSAHWDIVHSSPTGSTTGSYL